MRTQFGRPEMVRESEHNSVWFLFALVDETEEFQDTTFFEDVCVSESAWSFFHDQVLEFVPFPIKGNIPITILNLEHMR